MDSLIKAKSNSADETELIASKLAKILKPGDIIALYGTLGSGKTCFVRGLAKGLGIDAGVKSPSYNIINEYPGDTPLYHIDFYRLETESEIESTGWLDYLENNGIIAIEWAERIESQLPADRIDIKITISDKNRRILEIKANADIRNRHIG